MGGGLLKHLHDNSGLYKWSLPVATLAFAARPFFLHTRDSSTAGGIPFVTPQLFQTVSCAAAALVTAGTWAFFQWSVVAVDYLAENPYTEELLGAGGAGAGTNTSSDDPVRFVWLPVPSATSPSTRKLPVLHIDEPPASDHAARRANARMMGRKIAPLAFTWVASGLWLYQFVMRIVCPEEFLDRVLEALPADLREELESFHAGFRAGLAADARRRSCFLQHWDVRDFFRLQLLPDLKMFLTRSNPKYPHSLALRLRAWVDRRGLLRNQLQHDPRGRCRGRG